MKTKLIYNIFRIAYLLFFITFVYLAQRSNLTLEPLIYLGFGLLLVIFQSLWFIEGKGLPMPYFTIPAKYFMLNLIWIGVTNIMMVTLLIMLINQ